MRNVRTVVPLITETELSSQHGRTLVMGVLNVTPDSFSDGGKFFPREKAVAHGILMAEQGADIVDVGGESSRPFSEPVSLQEELDRIIPVIEALKKRIESVISVDTTKAQVAREAITAGAGLINDISALRFDPDMTGVVASSKLPVILMHMKGTPEDMQKNPFYSEIITEIVRFFHERIEHAVSSKIPKDRIILDPGIGFGKTFDHNLQIINRLKDFVHLGRPILLGTSRKAFIGKIVGQEMDQRELGTAATVAIGVYNGAKIIRVHDVAVAKQIIAMADAIKYETTEPYE
jgi:dihydropteroate synthase